MSQPDLPAALAEMTQLGIPVPDPATVKVGLWLRMQTRVAPVDRLLAAREAAEDEEVDDLYKRSTGDPATDHLLREIRKEERSHSLAVADMRAGGSGDDGGNSGSAAPPARMSAPGAANTSMDGEAASTMSVAL